MLTIVNWNFVNKFCWNFNHDTNIFFRDHTFINVIDKMLAFSSSHSMAFCINTKETTQRDHPCNIIEAWSEALNLPLYSVHSKSSRMIELHFQIWAPFYKHGLTLIPAWISNYTHYNMWDEIIHPFLNFNGTTV